MRRSMWAALMLLGCGVQNQIPPPPPVAPQPTPTHTQMAATCELKEPSKVVASQLESPKLIALDAESVYWASASAVWKAAKRGTATPVKLTEGLTSVTSLAAYAGAVYFIDADQLWAIPAGAAERTLVTSAIAHPRSLAVNARGLFFVDADAGAIKSVRPDGTGLTTLASGQRGPTQLKLDDDHAYWVNVEGAKLAAYTVMKLSLDGGEPRSLMGEQTFATGIALDATHVFVATYDRLLKVGKDGEGLQVVVSEQTISGAPVADAARVYWSAGGTSLLALDTSTSKVSELAKAAAPIAELAADASGVYWFSTGPSAVLNRACE